MSKRVVLIAMLLVFAVSAVTYAGGGITAKGVKAGINLATHGGGDADEHHKNRTAFIGGGFLTYALMNMLVVQPEVLFSMKGYKWEHGGSKWTGKYNYLEIPILFKYQIPMEGSIRPNLFAGPAPAFLLSAEEEWEYSDHNGIGFTNGDDHSGTTDVKDDTNSFDFGLIFGGGVDIDMGSGMLVFDVRYNLGLTKIDSRDDPNDIKNQVISIVAGYAR